MADAYREVGRTYAADPQTDLPPLTELLSGAPGLPDGATGAVRDDGRVELVATYFDTTDLRLAARGLTLRRRTGGPDAGWRLTVPAGDDARTEVRLPPGRAARTVPAPLRAVVRAVTLGATLRPVAEVRTGRTRHRLADATGRVLLELVDDRVTARRIQHAGAGDVVGPVGQWREVEVELGGGGDELLDAVDDRLTGLGLRPTGVRSTLDRVLGPVEGPGPRARLTRKSPAGAVVSAYLAEQLDALRAEDLRVHLDAPDAVHRMRVAARRSRSALTTFAPLFDADAVPPLRDGLGALADVLGAARDAELLRGRVRAGLEAPDAEAAVGAVTHGAAVAADADLAPAAQEASDAVRSWLDGEDYHRLLRELAAFVDDPPLTRDGRRRARAVLPERVARRDATLRRRLRRARRLPAGRRRDEALHRARKAARSARYAAEAVAGVLGTDAGRYARAAERLQEALGAHHDSVVARERLRELARRAPSSEVAFLLGRLHALEEARGRESDRAVRAESEALRRSRLRRWLG